MLPADGGQWREISGGPANAVEAFRGAQKTPLPSKAAPLVTEMDALKSGPTEVRLGKVP